MNVDAMIKHHQAVTEVITHAMSDYASAATGTSWNNACFAFEADAILCALSRAGFRILGPDEVDPVTVERCVEVAAATDPEKPANWLHRREEIAAAIRALSSPDHADAGKVEGGGCERCGGKGEIVVGKGRHGDTIIEDCPSCNTPQDVINLVIAAREACDTWLLPECEFKLLDKALEAFSERVPYENEPDALPSAPSEGAE